MSIAPPWVVYGAGGHGKVVADILFTLGHRETCLGFLDDASARHGQTVLGLPVLGGWDWLFDARTHRGEKELGILLGLGDNHVRQRVALQCEAAGHTLLTAVHPAAIRATSVTIGAGSVVMAGAVLNPDARVGKGVIVNTCAVIEHDVILGSFSHVSPNAALGGGVVVGELSQVGLGASVHPGVNIGREVTVGVGAAVVRDIPEGVIAAGVPARVLRQKGTPRKT